jgi:hypothetical protein
LLHPGIVAGWRSSRHAAVTLEVATAVEELPRKVSSDGILEHLAGVVVECAGCHTQRNGWTLFSLAVTKQRRADS